MNKLVSCLIGKKNSCIPIWFMRQAGRYLPEFKKIRSKNPDFINLCLNSELSSQITIQPITRFDLDAAIVFSDILMVPFALGQNVKFEKDVGPILSNFNLDSFLEVSEELFTKRLLPVYETIRITRRNLDKRKSLISFIGSPWTLAIYMLGLKQEKNILNNDLLERKRKELKLILKSLNKFLCAHIINQINSGADIVQIFDSWAGLIPEKDLDNYCYQPNQELVNFCKNNNIPVICFPKGIKKNYANFANIVKPDGLSIDYEINPEWARENLEGVCIQGGMDPKMLLSNDELMFQEAEKYIKIFKDSPYIFNLGHGLLPGTDPYMVEKLIKFVRKFE